MVELKPCPLCGREIIFTPVKWRYLAKNKPDELHWDCRIAQLEAELARRDEELKITDGLLKEATETIGAVIACCTYNSNDDAKIGVYGIDQNAFTKIDQFITRYNDTVSAGKVSVVVKRDLSDAEIEELGAQEAEKRGEK